MRLARWSLLGIVAAGLCVAVASGATGAPAVGEAAPPVAAPSVFGGKVEPFDLSKALASGAVVLYFFPQAFTRD